MNDMIDEIQDEKMCPRCGEFLPAQALFCTECGLKLSDEKEKKNTDSAMVIVVIVVIMAIVTLTTFVVFMAAGIGRNKESLSDGSVGRENNYEDDAVFSESDAETSDIPSEGYYEPGVYKIGSEIPEGIYIIRTCNREYRNFYSDSYQSICSDPDCSDVISGGWFQNSRIVKAEGDGYLEMFNCEAFAEDAFDGENNPFEHPGMFRCGIDFEPGTYKLVQTTDQGYQSYFVHPYIGDIDYKAILRDGDHGFEDGTEVTVRNGQILELSWCILEKNE